MWNGAKFIHIKYSYLLTYILTKWISISTLLMQQSDNQRRTLRTHIESVMCFGEHNSIDYTRDVLNFITLRLFIQKLYNKNQGFPNYESPCSSTTSGNIRYDDPENPTLETNMTLIRWPMAEISPFEFLKMGARAILVTNTADLIYSSSLR